MKRRFALPPILKPVLMLAVAMLSGSVACNTAAEDYSPDAIIALERGALDRWGKGDPQGYLDIMAPETTYFDPLQEKRIDGLDALREMLKPFTGKIKIDRIEMINPKVQRDGNVAVLTFNLISHVTPPGVTPAITARWNTTEVYRRLDGHWKIVHSHFSYVKPELKQTIP